MPRECTCSRNSEYCSSAGFLTEKIDDSLPYSRLEHLKLPALGFYIYGLQGLTKRCRLSWLTDSALVYEPKCGGRGGCGVSANEYSCAHGAQINFGDLIHI